MSIASGGARRASGCARPATILLGIALLISGCTHLPRRAYASVRAAEYLATHRELTPAVRSAIDRGHVILGMDREQVWVVLGEPLRKASFGDRDPIEVWIYPAHRLHQDPVRSHGATLFRIVLLDGRVALIEPI